MTDYAQTTPTRAERAQEYHPALWRRVRGACVWAASNVDLDDHAAGIIEVIVRAQVLAERCRRRP